MQPSRNFDDLKFSSIHRRILLWGSGGPFLDGYVLVMIGVALEQLTPALKLDADWIGLLGAGTLAGLFVGTSLFGLLISVAFAPETRGMSLAQTSNMTIRGQRMG